VRILGFGTYDISKHPRIGIVFEGLRARGDEVVEVNSPLGFDTADRVAMLQRPWQAYRLPLRVSRRWMTIVRRVLRVRSSLHFDAVVVGYMGHFDVLLGRLLFPRSTIVLDLLLFAGDTARDRGVRRQWTLRILRSLDSMAARTADIIIVDTQENTDLLATEQRHKAVVTPVGAPSYWFQAGKEARHSDQSRPLRVVFFGLFTPLQGTTVIGEALGLISGRSDIEATMIGTGQDWERARSAADANELVNWIEWVPAAELPSLVASHDVCLGIFGTTPKAFRVVPNKVYQGAAAGCAIVTSDTPPQRRVLDDAAIFVPPGDPRRLADVLLDLADDRSSVEALRGVSSRRGAVHFAPVEVVSALRVRLQAEDRLRTAECPAAPE
jgi:glycosyltransferase involved in cell wall biosynthesis